MCSFSRHCYNGFCLRIENGGHTEKRKMFLSFMWSKVEAFQIWENTVINLQPPRIMWCYKWRQLQTSFLQQEQNSVPPPWLYHCLSSSSLAQCALQYGARLPEPLPSRALLSRADAFGTVTPQFLQISIACTLTYGTLKFRGPAGLGGTSCIPESLAVAATTSVDFKKGNWH